MDGRRIVIAPDKFKGSLGALAAARVIERGLRAVPGCVREAVCIPMADGGEGTVDVFLESGAAAAVQTVRGPLGSPVEAVFAVTAERTAVLELASASGLLLVPPDGRDALRASTYGTGELIGAALDRGARRIVIGIGGSATTDGGMGLLVALGARFLDAQGNPLGAGGAALTRLASIDLTGLDARLAATTIEVACDVDSPLTGEGGAARLFASQKGASGAEIDVLEAALTRFADVSAALLGRDVRALPGAGAAGGSGYALAAFLGAALRPGVELIATVRGLDAALAAADLCITGEGRIDAQTRRGKTVAGIARLARAHGVPVIAFGGTVEAAAEAQLAAEGEVTVVPIAAGPMPLAQALADAPRLLEAAAMRVGRLLTLPGRRVSCG